MVADFTKMRYTKTIMQPIINLKEIPCFGVAGNFTGHLEQAGEASDFTKIIADGKNAPKAIFPTYIPGAKENVPQFLGTFPFDSEKIIFPQGEQKLQIEPECALICDVTWSENKITDLVPVLFGASNDCSIRKEGAKKISLKKNWGNSSKGLSQNLIPIDKFTRGGILDRYRIASFLVRQGEVFAYGEDSAVRDYSYIYEKLIEWSIKKLNTQQDEGPAENIGLYLNSCTRPLKILLSIGATRYTQFGETNFLKEGDKSVVVLYPEQKYRPEQIAQKLKDGNLKEDKEISVLSQTVFMH